MKPAACEGDPSPAGSAALGGRVRELREARGLTQAELARRSGLSPAMLSRILAGGRAPRMENLLALAGALGVTVAELVTGTSAAAAVEEWVPRALHEDSRRELCRADRELGALRAENRARVAEVDTLRNQLADAEARVEAAKAESLRRGAELGDLPRLRDELAQARAAAAAARAERNRLAAENAALREALGREQDASRAKGARLADARDRVARLQRDLQSARGEVAAGAVGAALDAVLIATEPG